MIVRSAFVRLVATLVLLFSVQSVRAEPTGCAYYMIVFGAQHRPNWPRYSHSFATFAKVVQTGTGPLVESQTISWLPETLDVNLFRLRPETGARLDLLVTLRWACEHCNRVSMWGPYQIQPELYERVCERCRDLDAGCLGYKALDWRFRPSVAVNCIHAISDADTEQGLLHTGTAYGDRASYLLLLHLSRWIIDPQCKDDWLIHELCLDQYRLCRQTWNGNRCLKYTEPPCSNGKRVQCGALDCANQAGGPESRPDEGSVSKPGDPRLPLTAVAPLHLDVEPLANLSPYAPWPSLMTVAPEKR